MSDECEQHNASAIAADLADLADLAGAATTSMPSRATPAPPSDDAWLRALFEQAPIGVAQCALDGRIIHVNPRLCALLGYSPAELLNQSYLEHTHPDDRAAILAGMRRLVAGELATFTMEQRLPHHDGSTLWVNLTLSLPRSAAGVPEGFLVLIEDSTARKRLEHERAEADALARLSNETTHAYRQTVLDVVPAGVAIADAHGKLLEANAVFREIWGMATAQGPDDFPHFQGWWTESGAPLAAAEWPLMRALRSGEAVRGDVLDIQSFDGQRKTILESAAPLRDAAGHIVGAIAALLDITERQRLNHDLAVQAGRLKAIVEAMTDGVAVADASGHVILRNTMLRHTFPMHEVPGFDDTLPTSQRGPFYLPRYPNGEPMPEDAWPITRVLRGETLTGAESVEMIQRAPNGQDYFLDITGAPVRDADGHLIGAVTVARDVTERRRLERRTHDSLNALLALAADLVRAPDGPTGDEAPGAGTSFSRQLAELTRRILGCHRVTVALLDARTHRLRPIAYACREGELPPTSWERVVHTPISQHLSPQDARRFFSGELFVITPGTPAYRTRAWLERAGATLVVPIAIGGRIIGSLGIDHGPNGHTYTVEEMDLADAAGKLIAIFLERDQLLREREAARMRALALEDASRRMDDFLGIASHELKTPITSARLNVQYALRQLPPDTGAADAALTPDEALAALERLRQPLRRTWRALDRQVRLIGDLLDAAHIRSGILELRPVPADLRAIVLEAVEEQRLMASSHEITCLVPAHAVAVLADTIRIGQVVSNYLANARKYSAPEQSIAITLRVRGGWARVSVRDHGPGLSRAEQALVWGRFYRASGVEVRSGSSVGLGLGLYVSRDIITRHGGRVGVRSTPGHGATFWFTLPLAEEA